MFVKATKKKQKARIGLIGPSGSGKTFTALTIAKSLANGGAVAVIDTERGSASKYSGDVADFDVAELGSYEPERYIDALDEAASASYAVVVIDSLSHAWEGKGGILDQVDQRGGRFDAWKDMSPQLRKLIDAILTYPGHVIATMRVKTEWVVEEVERKGRIVKEPKKIGLAPRFKEGLEYELDIVGTLDEGNTLHVSKSRCPALNGAVIPKPGPDVARAVLAWLEDGVDDEARILGVIAGCEGGRDLERAKEEIVSAAKLRTVDKAAHGRLVAAWKDRHAVLSGGPKTTTADAVEAE